MLTKQKSGKLQEFVPGPLPPISPILSLEDHRRLENLDRMPGACWDLHAMEIGRAHV